MLNINRFFMCVIIVTIVLMGVLVVGAQGVTVCCQTSASAEWNGTGYHLVVTGDPVVIVNVCAQGDCSLDFPDRLAALDYWRQLYNKAYNLNIAPLPTAIGP